MVQGLYFVEVVRSPGLGLVVSRRHSLVWLKLGFFLGGLIDGRFLFKRVSGSASWGVLPVSNDGALGFSDMPRIR